MRSLSSLLSRGVLALGVLAAAVGPSLAPASPAGAVPTAQQNFITKVYDDFLFGDPSSDQLLWWDTYLSNGGTRTNMVASVLGSTDFKLFWVIGVWDHYLGAADFDDPAITSAVTALNSSGNYLGTEIAAVSGNAYFALHGSTNTGWVSALYQDALQRDPDPTGLSYWVGRLDAGTSTRSAAATTILRSTESATRRVSGTAGATACAATELTDDAALAAGSYCIVLDRLADPAGASYWIGQLSGSSQLPSLWASLAGSNEYFNHAQP